MSRARELAEFGGVVSVNDTAVVVNEGGNDVDFRVEGDTDANTLFVDAGNDRVGVKTATPAVALDVVGQVRASTGILFGSDTAAANALDDYEEGTWTPTVVWQTGTPTYNSNGRYTKIGQIVSVQIAINVTQSGGSGIVSVTNLPFTSINEAQAGCGAERGNTGYALVVWIDNGTTQINMRYYDYTNVGTLNGDSMRVSAVYFV